MTLDINRLAEVSATERKTERQFDNDEHGKKPIICTMDGHWKSTEPAQMEREMPTLCFMEPVSVQRSTMGYKKLITYTLPDESGASLRAANWKCIGECGGRTWNRAKRPRVDTHPLQSKLRWEVSND